MPGKTNRLVREYIIRHDGNGDEVRANAIRKITQLDRDRSWRVVVQPFRRRRSNSQNRLMWAWLNIVADAVADHCGNDNPAEIHAFFKARFLPGTAIDVAGHWETYHTTTNLEPGEFSKYLDKIYRWCLDELGLILPSPGEWQEAGGDLAILQEQQDKREREAA